MDIQKGQRVKLSDVVSDTKSFQVEVSISGITVDMACFCLDSQQKLSNDAYMTFFNQPKTPCGAVELSTSNANSVSFLCQLDKLPPSINHLVFTAAVEGNHTMRSMQTGYLKFQVAGQTTSQFTFSGQDFQDEKAVMLGELYRKDDAWRFMANGQGFNGGLDSLVKNFGGEVLEEKPKLSLQKVSGKIELKKGQQSVIIEKTPEIIASISWDSGTDYDIYALVYTKDGKQIDVATFGAEGMPILQDFNNGTVKHMGDVGRTGKIKTEIIKIKFNDNVLAVVPVAYSAQSNGTGSFHRYKVSMLIDNQRGTLVNIPANNA
ncbi:MAG: hypothetical protein RLZ16_1243, partial [Bacteroidota bacterium]